VETSTLHVLFSSVMRPLVRINGRSNLELLEFPPCDSRAPRDAQHLNYLKLVAAFSFEMKLNCGGLDDLGQHPSGAMGASWPLECT